MKSKEAVHQVYISHSPREQELARDMARRLQAAGMQPLLDLDPRPSGTGKRALRARVQAADAVLMLVTPAAVESGGIIWDLGLAEGLGKVVVPITVGLDKGQLPEPLQTYDALPYDRLDEAIAGLTERLAGSR